MRSGRTIAFDVCACQAATGVPGRLNSAQRKQNVQRREKVTVMVEIK